VRDHARQSVLSLGNLEGRQQPANKMPNEAQKITIRPATLADRDSLRAMQTLALCVLGAGFYSPEEIEGFVHHVGTMDDFLLHERTYYVATRGGEILASGGWSRLRPNYSNATGPAGLAAGITVPKIRSVFVHPAFARRGLATRLMERAEGEARAAGFEAIELTATLSGVPLYLSRGYEETGRIALPLPGRFKFRAVTMHKRLAAEMGSARRLGAVG
jgi:GNAT superfamily N-acetyltransferase